MERVILARITDIVELHLPRQQAGFRKGKSTVDQLARLINDIEAAFQRKEKFGLVLVDLTAAYDTVWHKGLYLKLLKIIPDVKLVRFIMLLVQDRTFILETSNGDRSRKRKLRNGLPQGSVLAPILFNIYTADMPDTLSEKYLYADDAALGFTSHSFQIIESTLEEDLKSLSDYFDKWHLKISLKKTVCSVFHLANRLAKTQLKIHLNGKLLEFKEFPVYLGVTLDRSLTFSEHLRLLSLKTQSRVNLLKKLVGSKWGADFTTMRTSALALVFSTAEYASPVWSHSYHVKKLDVVINEALRLISGALGSTPTIMLPVIAGIPPADFRRQHLTLKLADKATHQGSLVPNPNNCSSIPDRINRDHFAKRARELSNKYPLSPNWIEDRWNEQWLAVNTTLHQYVTTPTSKPPGFLLQRKAWVQLNRLRTGFSKTNSYLNKIGALQTDLCVCGAHQSNEHIISTCPMLGCPNGKAGLRDLNEQTVEWLSNVIFLCILYERRRRSIVG